ncbi:hypothetical protein BUALT_Bualt01G0137700 [Buddleja alternifolia]|uniref:CUE domain-containing protein n=1 Tax=Buddleja alternifolia TaxID=168488 RepID=A0AAV6Y7X3_9LAMI|nr:hypothetical protein BUALT_Bualt01G0137700 [Buddleja alternifolia]
MSNRFNNQNRNDHKSSSKTQKKFIPKRDVQNPNSQQTLSNSLRASDSAATNTGDAAMASTSRVRLGENGEWVNKAFASGNFVIYLPQDEAVAAGLGPEEGGLDPVESQRVVDLLNRELSRLLKLHPKHFWTEGCYSSSFSSAFLYTFVLATDGSLYDFLESFLKFRSRWYDFPHRGVRGIVAGVIVGEFELCRRVFMVLYRLSSNRDPGAKVADTLSPKDHAALLQDKKLLDLPKLLDICAVYGDENEDLTRILVMNAIKAQPYIQDDFPVLMSHFLNIVQTMHQRCSSTLEVLLSSGGNQDQGSSRLHFDYLEVMDFINDAVVSMDSFVNAYKHSAVFFSSPVETSYGNEELITTLARLHDSLLPSLLRGFRIILGTEEKRNKEISDDLLSNVFISLKMLSTRVAKFGWKLLYFCYLSDEAFESSFTPPVSMKMFPANVEDPVVRADIIIQSIRELSGDYLHVPGARTWGTLLHNIEKNHNIMSRIELLQKKGWISIDDEQLQFLSGIMTSPPQTDTRLKTSASFPVTNHKMQADEDTAIIESKISQIKELFPDYGRGFLVACLEAYNHDAEEVIQRILENTLHEELQSLDISLDKIPLSKSASSVNNSKYDKGKGKLVEPTLPPPVVVGPTALKNQAGASSGSKSSSIGRFVRKNTNDLSESETLNAKREKELEKTAALISQQLEYEDEYDDSFDDLGMSVGDSGLDEPETLGDKIESDGGGGSSSSKWGSRKKPQFYVKDGKNYSYKVDGSVAASNYNEARLLNLAQKETVHGLGRGGNIPFGASKRLTEWKGEQDGEDSDDVGGGRGFGRGNRGRRGRASSSGVKVAESNDDGGDGDEVGGRGERGIGRSGGGRRGRGRNQFIKNRAMSKHLSGLPAHFNS